MSGSSPFRKAVEETPNLAASFRAGLRALRAQDRPHIQAEDTRRLTGSVDVDTSLQKVEPNANRWDFAIGYKHTNQDAEVLYWVELHTASDAEVKVVIKKASWLLSWLAADGKKLAAFQREIIWVSSGVTSFTLTDPHIKLMAQAGLRHVGSRLRIRNER